MTMLAASGFGIYAFTQIDAASPLWQKHDHALWQQIGFRFEHPEWESKFGVIGVSFWDLIEPAFMFMVGAAMPFSYRRRATAGAAVMDAAHPRRNPCRWCSCCSASFCIRWAVRPRIGSSPNVLCQIGLGYLFAYALLGLRWYWQVGAIAVILAGYWALFYFNPPPNDHD